MTPRGFNKYFLVIGAGRNKKFVRLTDGERCAHFLGICSLAAQSPVRGYLLISEDEEAGAEEVAGEAGVSLRVAMSAIAKLKQRGVLEWDEELGAWYIHDWDEINPPPKADATAAERQRRRRAKAKALRDNRDGHATVTQLSRRDNRDVTDPSPEEVEVEEEVKTLTETFLPKAQGV